MAIEALLTGARSLHIQDGFIFKALVIIERELYQHTFFPFVFRVQKYNLFFNYEPSYRKFLQLFAEFQNNTLKNIPL